METGGWIMMILSVGTVVTLSVEASGTQAFYQWRREGVPIPGAIGIDYTFELAAGDCEATYDCVVTNFCGSDGSDIATGSIAMVPDVPSRLLVEPAFPNPFVASTSVRFAMPQRGSVRAAVYDIAGRRVAVLLNGTREAGWHRLDWFGTDDQGHEVAAGVYFVRVETGAGVRQHKVVRLN